MKNLKDALMRKIQGTKDHKDNLKLNDIVVISMGFFPNGAIGENVIQKKVLEIIEHPEFKYMKEDAKYVYYDNAVFSFSVHNALEKNSKFLRGVISSSNDYDSCAIFSDLATFDDYDSAMAVEKNYDMFIRDHVPKVYFMTPPGKELASVLLREKATKRQREVIRDMFLEND